MNLNPTENCRSSLPITEVNPNTYISTAFTPSTDTTGMAVAQKSSSSGFMLLSVKHQTKRVKHGNIGLLMHKHSSQSDDYYDDSCIGKSSSMSNMKHLNGKRNSFETGRQFESTVSLNAEEYDDEDDDDDLDANSEPHDMIFSAQLPHAILQPQNNMPLQPNLLNLSNVRNFDPIVNGQSVDEIHANSKQFKNDISANGWPPIVAPTSHNILDKPGVENALPFPDYPNSVSAPVMPVSATQQFHYGANFSEFDNACMDKRTLANLQEAHDIDNNAPCLKSPDLCTSSLVPNNQMSTHPTQIHPSTPPMQSTHPIEQLTSASDAPNLSSQIYLPINPPTQTASRFRKARIRETVEQWNSNRVSFHDCRLKALPDWVSDLQVKIPSSFFEHPTVQHSRCLYCFVPGTYSGYCVDRHHLNRQQSSHSNPISSPTKKEFFPNDSFSVTGVLQAAMAAYQSNQLQGFNSDSLFASWISGRRCSRKISPDVVNLHGLSRHRLKTKTTIGDTEKRSTYPNEQSNISSDHLATGAISFTAGHNSTDLVNAMESEKEFSASLNPSYHNKYTALSESTVAQGSQLQSNDTALDAEPCQFTDPSTEYLRRRMGSQQSSVPDNDSSIDAGEGILYGAAGEAQICQLSDQNNSPENQPEINEKLTRIVQNYAPPTSPAYPATISSKVLISDDVFMLKSPNNKSWIAGRENEMFGKDATPFLDINRLLGEGNTLRRHPMDDRTIASLANSSPQSPDPELQSSFSHSTYLSSVVTNDETLRVRQASASSLDAIPIGSISGRCESGMDFGVTANGCSNVNYASGERASSMGPPSTQNDHLTKSNASEVGVSGSSEVFPPLGTHGPHTSAPLTDFLETRMPNSMDMIRLAIMTTFKEEVSELNTLNASLREAIQKLHCENVMLRGYQRAFQALQPYVPPKIWEQLEVQVQLEACQQYQQSLSNPPVQLPPQLQQIHTTQSMGTLIQNRVPSPIQLAQVDSSTGGPFRQSPVNRGPQHELPNNSLTKISPNEIPSMPDTCANIQSSMQHHDN